MFQTLPFSVLIMGISVVLALVGLHLVRSIFPHPVRQANNEVAGFFIAVLGVIYAVLLAFVVVTVWEQYDGAKQAVDSEATELTVIYRLALELPDPTGTRLRDTVHEYAVAVVDQDWPAMGRGAPSPPGVQRLSDDLWKTATRFEPSTPREQILQAEAVRSLHDFIDSRRTRELASRTGLPGIMWALLIGGALVTIGYTYFFSTPNPRAQYAMTAGYTMSITFVLMLIALLDFPFSGDVKVNPEAFELALQTFERLSGH